MTVSGQNEIHIEFDEVTNDYYVVWEPIAMGAGKTRQEALDDLRQAAHFGIDTFIDLKLKDIDVSL